MTAAQHQSYGNCILVAYKNAMLFLEQLHSQFWLSAPIPGLMQFSTFLNIEWWSLSKHWLQIQRHHSYLKEAANSDPWQKEYDGKPLFSSATR